MSQHIRAAEPRDIPAIMALLLGDARIRQSLMPRLWSIAPDAASRVAASLATVSQPVTGPLRHHWMVAERDGAIVAVAHGVNLPAPPIIELRGGTAGILMDDSHFSDDRALSAALLAATEQALRDAGAMLFVAASPANWTARTNFLEESGYEPTTLYMAKAGLAAHDVTGAVRKADAADIAGIVRLSALHRARLQKANPVFWNIHAEADSRFAAWMRTSLDLPDRSMFVCGPAADITGFIIAQPGSPLHLPPAHDAASVGLIDDFYTMSFEPAGDGAGTSGPSRHLIEAAEDAFHARGIDVALAICPVRMTAKVNALRDAGYETANLWLVKSNRHS